VIEKKLIIKNFTLKNRVVVGPMCQYSGFNGNPSNWHYQHLGRLSLSGAGMLILESTAVSKEGMITRKDLRLESNKNKEEFKKILKFIRSISDIPIGIQLSHSGRKGSSEIPWIKSNAPLRGKYAWQTFAPSPIAKDKSWPKPLDLNIDRINKIKKQFIRSAKNAKDLNFDCLEIHMAHGYLLHQFFSPISNKRKDLYGGDLLGRSKFLLEVAKSIRKIWPQSRILGARITGSDRLKNGINIKDSIYISKKLEEIGFDYICVSSGGIQTKTNLNNKIKGYNIDLAKKIKKEVNILVTSCGNLNDINFSDNLIKSQKIDFVTVARGFIKNNNYLILNEKFKKKIEIPNQYYRCIY
jgi:2,4-dienoyl-CoA reductase-like NADH-dependent reductase (Old Yellow Enzyme family)